MEAEVSLRTNFNDFLVAQVTSGKVSDEGANQPWLSGINIGWCRAAQDGSWQPIWTQASPALLPTLMQAAEPGKPLLLDGAGANQLLRRPIDDPELKQSWICLSAEDTMQRRTTDRWGARLGGLDDRYKSAQGQPGGADEPTI
jgi:hypothetical protein